MRSVVIVGASVAGTRAAQALRREGFDGRVVLVGDEPFMPYDRPPLSKQYLGGTFDAERLTLLDGAAAASEGIELRLGVAAEALDVSAHEVRLADGSSLTYDSCVIATGAAARPSPWGATSGVHVLRTRPDSDRLRQDLAQGGHAVVVGGGFIGAEVASTAAGMGCRVTVVDPLRIPVARVVGEEIGAVLTTVHERHGVATRFGIGVSALDGRAGALEVRLTDGAVLHADTAVVGIGAVPQDGWLASSGLLVDNGVVCDEYCRAVDAPDVCAAGDVARWMHLRHAESTRVEHWTNAVEQAACVAHNIAHPEDRRSYQPVGYVWSDQYDWKIQIAGRPERGSSPEVVGDLDGPRARLAALYPDEQGRLAGAVTVNWPRALVECRRLLRSDVALGTAVRAVEALGTPPGDRGPE